MACPLEPEGARGDRKPSGRARDRQVLPRRCADDRGHLPRGTGDRRHRLLQVRGLERAERDARLRGVHEDRGVLERASAEAAGRGEPLMADVKVVDRSSLLAGMYEQLSLAPKETAIVTIDMHRGHLDMDVATMPAKPEDARRVIDNAARALDFARAKGVPIIHVVLVNRKIKGLGSEAMVSPFWKALHAAQGER